MRDLRHYSLYIIVIYDTTKVQSPYTLRAVLEYQNEYQNVLFTGAGAEISLFG